jgi:hypothetical protein
LHSNENEHWNLFWVMEQYDMIENRSKNWTENQVESQIEDHIEIKVKIKLKIELNTTEQTENFISKVILPDHIIFYVLYQNSDLWHEISSIIILVRSIMKVSNAISMYVWKFSAQCYWNQSR